MTPIGFYNTCPDCGANLDPGERCECRETTALENQAAEMKMRPYPTHYPMGNERLKLAAGWNGR